MIFIARYLIIPEGVTFWHSSTWYIPVPVHSSIHYQHTAPALTRKSPRINLGFTADFRANTYLVGKKIGSGLYLELVSSAEHPLIK